MLTASSIRLAVCMRTVFNSLFFFRYTCICMFIKQCSFYWRFCYITVFDPLFFIYLKMYFQCHILCFVYEYFVCCIFFLCVTSSLSFSLCLFCSCTSTISVCVFTRSTTNIHSLVTVYFWFWWCCYCHTFILADALWFCSTLAATTIIKRRI